MIALAKQKGNNVWVYNERGSVIFSKSGVLIGYTGNTISVKSSSGTIWVYDDTGRVLFGK